MSEYKLLGERITLSDPAERFFDMQQETWEACEKAEEDFKEWYQKRSDIEAVLRGYVAEAESLIVAYALQPLFDRLATEYGISNWHGFAISCSIGSNLIGDVRRNGRSTQANAPAAGWRSWPR